MRTLMIGLALLTYSTISRADAPESFRDYLQGEVSTLEDALGEATTNDNDRMMFFRRFWFRLRPNVTFTAGVAKIGIVPELELLWERPLPEGWMPFHP